MSVCEKNTEAADLNVVSHPSGDTACIIIYIIAVLRKPIRDRFPLYKYLERIIDLKCSQSKQTRQAKEVL